MDRAVIYARVSTDEQAINGASLEVQEARCRAYGKARGWRVGRAYRDDGYSAKTIERPALRAMLRDIDAGQGAIVVVYRVDRLTRRLRDLLELTESKRGIALVSVTEAFDTATPAGRAMLSMLGTFAQFERETIAGRIRDALRHRKQTGKVYGSVPLGFDRVSDRLVPCLAEQRIVWRILRERRSGRPLWAIADRLNRGGVATKRGGRWHASTIRAVLGNTLHQGGMTR